MAAAPFPNWLMMERFVFRRDDKGSFPDATKAPIRASGTTSWNARFHIAFCLAEPPLPSRLYARLPRFPDPRKHTPLAILAAHRHLLLLRIGTDIPGLGLVQDFLIYSAYDTSSLKALPPCTEPYTDYTRTGDSLPRGPPLEQGKHRLLTVKSIGLLCRGGEGEQEFAVAELCVFKSVHSEVYADVCLLRSSTSAGPVLAGEWNAMRLPILGIDNVNDPWHLCCWDTDAIVPFNRSLCWIDYHRGMLIYDVFAEHVPTVTFLALPLDEFPSAHTFREIKPFSWLYRGVSAIDDGRVLKFVNVTRHDGIGHGELKSGSGFTITCHTLALGSMVWELDYKITSAELWSSNPHLPHTVLMFPQVNVDRPYVVHFLISEFKYVIRKMWVVSIDMSTRIVESISQYINGKEGLETDDADFTRRRSGAPASFLPCEFSRFLRLSRKNEDMG
ncbi:hypothetical protein CFC21_074226 [Triticum aestivum]|uniref:DUF1618 domain-containing protein n=3 Tax=Triticum TaxID=4564 RepID=A0A9R0XLB3_TRITD|nr:uncharacterized protein LOC123117318 [Triticum aestivum]KAF7068476.1 hypothetical protein CFC21_074226 [Triticum aestivum]VAI38538.1 unnamed protein product [Triticum turgidum subsp. durum]